VQTLTIAASVTFHAAITALLSASVGHGSGAEPAATPAATAATAEPEPSAVLNAPSVAASSAEVVVEDLEGELPRVTAGDPVAHVDHLRPGHGGDVTASEPALNLADEHDRMRLSPDTLSRLDRDQLQRLRVARARSSWEDRRSTPHPAELTLVVMGPGAVRERRPSAEWSPSRGALDSPAPAVAGGEVGADPPSEAVGEGERPGGPRAGSRRGEPGTGLLQGRPGADHRRSAPVGEARPDVVQGSVAVPAREHGRPRDSLDAQQEVATTVRSLVLASTMGGLRGAGAGGSGGGGAPGAGAESGAGSTARAMGLGEGDVFDYWTTDPRLVMYFRRIHAKVDPLWRDAFPKSALFELKQGTVILDITVAADGTASVSWPPVRPSGVEDFDRNCADAVRRASPFPPIPPELGVRTLHIRAPFVASNPVVK
jgi:TonB family protein